MEINNPGGVLSVCQTCKSERATSGQYDEWGKCSHWQVPIQAVTVTATGGLQLSSVAESARSHYITLDVWNSSSASNMEFFHTMYSIFISRLLWCHTSAMGMTCENDHHLQLHNGSWLVMWPSAKLLMLCQCCIYKTGETNCCVVVGPRNEIWQYNGQLWSSGSKQ
jgi:hypothetical protein